MIEQIRRSDVHIKNRVAQLQFAIKPELAEDLRPVFHNNTDVSTQAGWEKWQAMHLKWADHYRSFKKLSNNQSYYNGFTYLQFN